MNTGKGSEAGKGLSYKEATAQARVWLVEGAGRKTPSQFLATCTEFLCGHSACMTTLSERPCRHRLQSPGTQSWRRGNTVPVNQCSSSKSLSPLPCLYSSQSLGSGCTSCTTKGSENVKEWEREGSMTKRKKKKEERNRTRKKRRGGRGKGMQGNL